MKKNLPAIVLFLFSSGALIFSWFRFGLIYGGGDVGLPTYDPQRIIEVARYIWWESAAPGYPVPQGLSSVPLQFALLFIQFLGFSPLGLQATLFLILLFLMGFGMYLLALSIFGKENSRWAMMAGLFYMFNPYMLVQIWHRFVHTSIVLVAVLPFLVLFWRFWIKNHSPKFLLFFLLTNFLGVYLYGTIAFILTIWLLLFLITAFESLVPWKNFKFVLQNSLLFMIGLILWLLINSWWLIPTFTVGSALFSEQHTTDESLITLLEISRQEVLPFSLQMINPFYLFEQTELGEIYKNLFFRVIPWIFVAIILLGFVKSLFNKKFIHFGLMFLIFLFLTKGAASPFGYPYILAFGKFFIFGALRNPFEKIGILLPLFASILFVIGLKNLESHFGHKTHKVVLIIAVVLVSIFTWPMFLGTVFGTIDKPSFIKVPDYYTQANQWIKSQNKTGKILHLPLTTAEAISYQWEYGYNGVESSNLFFTSNPSISRGLNIKTIDDTLSSLSLTFHPYRIPDENRIIDLLRAFDIRFIILHKDMKWQGEASYQPNEAEKILDSLTFLDKKAQFGDLKLYELSDKYYQPRIVVPNDVLVVAPINAGKMIWQLLVDKDTMTIASSSALISSLEDSLDDTLRSYSNETMIFAKNTFSYHEVSTDGLDHALNQLVFSQNFTSNSPIYNLLVIKQYLDRIKGNLSKESVAEKIVNASQNLVQLYQLSSTGQVVQLLPVIKQYSHLIDEVFVKQSIEFRLYSYIQELSEIFKLHLLILQNIQPKLGFQEREEISKPINRIKDYLKEKQSLPSYPFLGNSQETGQRQIFQFWIPVTGKYELFMINPQIQNAYRNGLKQIDFQIDDKLLSLEGKRIDKLISFGEIDFKEGNTEISISNPPSTNLISDFGKFIRVGNVKLNKDGDIEMTSDGINPSFFEISLNPVSGKDIYQLSFETKIQSGDGFYFQILQNNDPIEKEGKKPRIGYLIPRNQYNSDWIKYSFNLPPLTSTAQDAKIRFTVGPGGGQLLNNFGTVLVRNFKMVRVLNNEIFLKNKKIKEDNRGAYGQISKIEQKNPVFYEGEIKLLRPGFIFFKESYHPGWRLRLYKGNEVYEQKKHYLAYMYGNAWYIEKSGEYKFKLEFEPQQKVIFGLYLAGIGWLIIVLLWGGVKFKKMIWKQSK